MDYIRTPNTKCLVCNIAVYRRPSWLVKTNGRAFCSVICHGQFLKREHPCLICKTPILSSKNKVTCSRACANIHRSGIRYKSNLPRKDRVKNARALKLRLLSLGKHKCERCDYSKIEVLQVHHKDRNRNNNDLSNLELICPNCHYEEHFLKDSWLKDFDLAGFERKIRLVNQ